MPATALAAISWEHIADLGKPANDDAPDRYLATVNIEAGSRNAEQAELFNVLGKTLAKLGTVTSSRADLDQAILAYDLALMAANTAPGGVAFQLRVAVNKTLALWNRAALGSSAEAALDLAEAARLLRHGLSILPADGAPGIIDYPRMEDTLGSVLLRQGELDDALVHLERARKAWRGKKAKTDRARTLRNIGVVYEQKFLRQPSAALLRRSLEAYSQALALLDPHTEPHMWSEIKRFHSTILWRQANHSETPASDAAGLMEQAAKGLKQAWEACPGSLLTLRASIARELGDTLFMLADICNNEGIAQEAVISYIIAIALADDQLRADIFDIMKDLEQYFNDNFPTYRPMARPITLFGIEIDPTPENEKLLSHAVQQIREEISGISANIATTVLLPRDGVPSRVPGPDNKTTQKGLTNEAPKVAPVLWENGRQLKDGKLEYPDTFIMREYKTWLDSGVLHRDDLKRLDIKLYNSLNDHLKLAKKGYRSLASGFNLPTKEEANRGWAAKIEAEKGSKLLITDAQKRANEAARLYRQVAAADDSETSATLQERARELMRQSAIIRRYVQGR